MYRCVCYYILIMYILVNMNSKKGNRNSNCYYGYKKYSITIENKNLDSKCNNNKISFVC